MCRSNDEIPEKDNQAIRLYSYNREVPDSNFERITGYKDGSFRDFSQSLC
jgi:hypothetical protein